MLTKIWCFINLRHISKRAAGSVLLAILKRRCNMKIQLAVDRVSIEKAVEIVDKAKDYVDIIEVGTSLIKDYGMESLRSIRGRYKEKCILADIKTIDEGEYEFKAAFENGADIATVMGAASIETLDICYYTAKKYNKVMMIDMLQLSDEKIKNLDKYQDAIFCIHTPSDNKADNIGEKIKSTKKLLPDIKRLAIAGGINMGNIDQVKEIEIVILGSAITKSDDIKEAAKKYHDNISGL
jgi:3-hexulose-6-phosphate synthase and related proteins